MYIPDKKLMRSPLFTIAVFVICPNIFQAQPLTFKHVHALLQAVSVGIILIAETEYLFSTELESYVGKFKEVTVTQTQAESLCDYLGIDPREIVSDTTNLTTVSSKLCMT